MTFSQVVDDIKSLRIQGAKAVAREAVRSLRFFVDKPKNTFYADIATAKKTLLSTRVTEPMMHNALKYVLAINNNLSVIDGAKRIKERMEYFERFFEETEEKIALFGSKKIKSGMTIATHCHSSTVIDILRKAKEDGKSFKVLCTETRPLFQGRITANQLAKLGIPVTLMVDSAAASMLKQADLFLLGADAIMTEGSVYNKIGSGMFAQLAARYDCPLYICTQSWKLDVSTLFGADQAVEQRSADEVWKERPKGVVVSNPAFERIDSDLIRGVICELGIYAPEQIVSEVEQEYPYLFTT